MANPPLDQLKRRFHLNYVKNEFSREDEKLIHDLIQTVKHLENEKRILLEEKSLFENAINNCPNEVQEVVKRKVEECKHSTHWDFVWNQ